MTSYFFGQLRRSIETRKALDFESFTALSKEAADKARVVATISETDYIGRHLSTVFDTYNALYENVVRGAVGVWSGILRMRRKIEHAAELHIPSGANLSTNKRIRRLVARIADDNDDEDDSFFDNNNDYSHGTRARGSAANAERSIIPYRKPAAPPPPAAQPGEQPGAGPARGGTPSSPLDDLAGAAVIADENEKLKKQLADMTAKLEAAVKAGDDAKVAAQRENARSINAERMLARLLTVKPDFYQPEFQSLWTIFYSPIKVLGVTTRITPDTIVFIWFSAIQPTMRPSNIPPEIDVATLPSLDKTVRWHLQAASLPVRVSEIPEIAAKYEVIITPALVEAEFRAKLGVVVQK